MTMLRLHPIIQLSVALLTIAAAFLAHSLSGLLPIYAIVVVAVVVTGTAVSHLRFTVFTIPILAALLLVWGLVMSPASVPVQHFAGYQYAFFCWLRIVISGGVLQALFIPLLEHPNRLQDFLDRTGLAGAIGTLIISSIIFIPETRRRLVQIVDARKAQGYTVVGFAGLRDLPTLLMPLVASLLDSSVKRAELWGHRDVLARRHRLDLDPDAVQYSRTQGAVAATLAVIACLSGMLA